MKNRTTTGHVALLLFLFLILPLLSPQRTHAQTQAITLSLQGIVGVNQVVRGDFIQIYAAQLQDPVIDGVTPRLGWPGNNLGIRITLSDLTTTTNIQATDLASLSLYRSDDAVFDGTDALIDTQTPTIGSVIEFDATGFANRTIPGGLPFPYFIIIASTSPSATLGTAFRLGAVAGHIGLDDAGFGGLPGTIGAQIFATDANHVVIGSVATSGGVPVTIPFGGEAVIVLLLVGTGIYALRRAA